MVGSYRIGFTIKPAAIKIKRETSTTKEVTKMLYCSVKKTEEGWKAYINTNGLKGYNKITVLPFTEKSFDLTGHVDVFLHNKDKNGKWVHITRHINEANYNPGSPEVYCTLCENSCFSGRIVKVNNTLQFNLNKYEGRLIDCKELLTKSNKKSDNDEETEE